MTVLRWLDIFREFKDEERQQGVQFLCLHYGRLICRELVRFNKCSCVEKVQNIDEESDA